MLTNSKKTKAALITGILIFVMSCTTFMVDQQVNDILSYQHVPAVMKKKIELDENKLDSGQRVKLYFILNDNSIRVYAYPAEVEFLKAERLLILYLFEDDFKDGRYHKDYFFGKLNEVVSLN